jgi:hypothetical protein
MAGVLRKSRRRSDAADQHLLRGGLRIGAAEIALHVGDNGALIKLIEG